MINHKEQTKSFSSHEVLDNALNRSGYPAGPAIISDVLENPQIDGIQIIGEGGSGKTAIIVQVLNRMQELLNERIHTILPREGQELLAKRAQVSRMMRFGVLPQILPFDRFVTKVVEDQGVHQSAWAPETWGKVSDAIFSTVDPKLEEIAQHNKRARLEGKGPSWILITDPVVLGNLDKGREAAKKIGKRSNVRTWGVPSDFDNKTRAAQIRKYVLQEGLSEEAIENILLDQGIIYDGDFGKVPALMRRMATPELMAQSDNQVEKQIDDLQSSGIIDASVNPLPESVIQKIKENTPANQLDRKLVHYSRRFPHMMYVLRIQLGIPQPQCDVLFNIHLRDQKIHWYQNALERAANNGGDF